MSEESNGVPAHWATAALDEIAEVRLGRQRSPDRATGDHMRPYLRAANVTWNGISLHDVKEMDFTPKEFETYELLRGDILLAEASGSASEVGKPAIWKDELPGCCFQNTLLRVRADESLVRFLHLHFTKDAVTGAFAAASRGVGIHHLGAQAMCEWKVRLPPLGEQQRIVEAIESYFTRLDDAVAMLERVERSLKRYRASVLKSAVEGRLAPTEAALAKQEGRNYEPASILLERILTERRRCWSEPGKKGKYQEPIPPDITELPDLPEGWCWATWSQVGVSQNGRAFPSGEYQDSGVRLLRPGNLHASGHVDWKEKNTRYMPEAWGHEYPEHIVGGKELVMNLTAQSLKDEFLGRVCITPDGERCLLNQRIARLVPIAISPKFMMWIFKSPLFRRFVGSLNTGSLIQHMFTSQLDGFVFPLPPLDEQRRISDQIERQFAIAVAVEHDARINVQRAGRLRQSILKWAFEGKLADQDPNDEPASILLERIKAERETAKPAKTARPSRDAGKKKLRA